MHICSGAAALSRAKEQLRSMDSRIDRLKAQLYFPSVEGYRCCLHAVACWTISLCGLQRVLQDTVIDSVGQIWSVL